MCARCSGGDAPWCAACERAYDGWVRRYASDVIWPLVAGMIVVMTCAMALPLLGVSWLVGAAGAIAGFGTVGALARLSRWRRRRQFRLGSLPRAALLSIGPAEPDPAVSAVSATRTPRAPAARTR
jgi:hypothetical protein